jgi:hypothetical protein
MPVNFSGTWTANLPKSTFRTPPPTAMIAHITHEEPELDEEIVVIQTNGTESRAVLRCRTDGDQTKTQLNGDLLRGGARWDGQQLVVETWLQLGSREMYLCDRWSLSPDGQTLTMEHRDDDLAGHCTVFDRME